MSNNLLVKHMLELPNFLTYHLDNDFVAILKIHLKAFEYLLEFLGSKQKNILFLKYIILNYLNKLLEF